VIRGSGTVDDLRTLQRILDGAKTLLLDFDGPVCSVFAGFPAPVVAQQLREVLAQGDVTSLPDDVQETHDPFDIFKYAASIGFTEGRYVEAALRAHEVEAVGTAEPTKGGHALVDAWRRRGRQIAIVSNNSTAALEAYFDSRGETEMIDLLIGRTSADPKQLKPNPYLVFEAMTQLDAKARDCVLIGDSLTDIQAGQSAGVVTIGYANRSGKVDVFQQARTTTVVTSMLLLAQAAATVQ
jgi:phosphoglycolate phosphatase